MKNTSENATRTALITGITGFIGTHLASRLKTAGWSVHGIVRNLQKAEKLEERLAGVVLQEHDGSTESLIAIVSRVQPTVVFHLASLFIAEHRPEDVERLVSSNVLFGSQLAEAMVTNRTYALVNTGTSWQHYQNDDNTPVCLYAATKQAYEAILHYYTEAYPLKVITLKLYDTYGSGDRRQKLFTILRKLAADQRPLAMSPGEQLVDLVYIDDVTDAFVMAAERLLSQPMARREEYAVSSGKPVCLKDLVRLYGQLKGTPLPVEWGKRPYRSREVMVPWTGGRPLPGWKPKVGLEEGILRMEKHASGDPLQQGD
jgi:nucleoside-diphosphate-sugar epimerase